MTTCNTIQGLRFFNSSTACITSFQQASWVRKALSWIQSLGRMFLYLIYRPFFYVCKLIHPKVLSYTLPLPSTTAKPKLVVCLHGLNGSPSQFRTIISEFQKCDLSEVQIYTPLVLRQGNARLDDAVEPILKQIQTWANTPGDKELILIGVSNGGRIARSIDAELIKPGNSGNIRKLRFISIVGACKGSALVNLAHRCHLSWLTSKPIAEEMPTNSARNQKLDKDLSNLSTHTQIKRDYTFIASAHDWIVPNYNSTLMDLPSSLPARYALVSGHGHEGVQYATAAAIAEISLKMKWP